MAKMMQVEIFGTRAQLDDVVADLERDGYTVVGSGDGGDKPKLDLVLREIEDEDGEDDEDGPTYSIAEQEA